MCQSQDIQVQAPGCEMLLPPSLLLVTPGNGGPVCTFQAEEHGSLGLGLALEANGPGCA
jgi:hypothetical protein